MIYAATFFGIILGISIITLIITGEFPKGVPLVVIWVIALAALFFVGYRRLYSSDEEQDQSNEKTEQDGD